MPLSRESSIPFITYLHTSLATFQGAGTALEQGSSSRKQKKEREKTSLQKVVHRYDVP